MKRGFQPSFVIWLMADPVALQCLHVASACVFVLTNSTKSVMTH